MYDLLDLSWKMRGIETETIKLDLLLHLTAIAMNKSKTLSDIVNLILKLWLVIEEIESSIESEMNHFAVYYNN